MRLLLALILWLLAAPAQAGHNEPIGCAQVPALTGDTTASAASCATTNKYHLVSTQTASSSASIAWTALGTTYNNYEMVCAGVFPVTNNASIFIQTGQGATPTWNTATYKWEGYSPTSAVTSSAFGSGSASGVPIDLGNGIPNVATNSASFTARIFNLPSTTTNKSITMIGEIHVTNGNLELGGGSYTGDTNAVTSIRIIASSGNISSGTCSLFGLGP